jgi:hypothetical protein
MGAALDTICVTATAAAAVGSAGVAAAGDSLIVRSIPPDKKGWLLNVWADKQTAAFFQITSPRLHDNTRGLRFRDVLSEVVPYFPFGVRQQLFDQDQLAVTIAGAAVAGDIESVILQVYYEDLKGVEARLIDYDTLQKRGVELVTVEDTITTGAGGGYTGGEALNAESDLLKGNQDYAWLGSRVSVECAAICMRGADTGNLRAAIPGNELAGDMTSNWFVNLSRAFGMPLIPVFNSANRAGITVDAVQDENAAAVPVSHLFARLA